MRKVLGGLGTKEQLLLCVAQITNVCFSPCRSSKAGTEKTTGISSPQKNNAVLLKYANGAKPGWIHCSSQTLAKGADV